MTCIVAAHISGKTVIGAESCTSVNDRKLVNMVNGSKLVKFPHFIVGLSGYGPLREILDTMSVSAAGNDDETEVEDWSSHKLETTLDVSKFLEKFMELFQDRGDAEAMDSVELLFVTEDKMFCTMGEGTVFEVGLFWSVGGGSSYALGAMELLHHYETKPLEAQVAKAIEIACKYTSGCEGPIEILTLGS